MFPLAEITVNAILAVLIIGLVLYLIYFLCSKIVSGTPLQIIGIILVIILIAASLNRLGIYAL